MSSRPLNATAASLLGFLHEGPMTGWDLVATAQQRIGNFWTLTQSQVYRELTAMSAAGFIKAGPAGPRDRKPYTTTATGRAAFADWLDGTPGAEQVRVPLLLTLAFGHHLPAGRLGEIVAEQRLVHAERLAEYERALGEMDGAEPARLATLDFGIRHERAVLDWFDNLPAIVDLDDSRAQAGK